MKIKKKHFEYTTYILLIILSFFLGRESKTLSLPNKPSYGFEKNDISIDGTEFQSLDMEDNLFDLSSTAYVCNGRSSKRYHFKKNCRGLSSCRSSISEVTIEEAKKRGRTLCGWED